MKRTLAWGTALAILPLLASPPASEATGAAACLITGTITFAPARGGASGTWTIDPAVITCHGLFNGYERIVSPGRFTGTGTYTALPGGADCLHTGSGTVDYTFSTTASDVHLVEPNDYTWTGIGTISSPSLNGMFQISPPYEGDCVTTPITRALFVAEATLVRFVPPDPDRYLPPKR